VLHAVLALYVVAFAMGIAVVALSVLAYIRFSTPAFRQLAVVASASLLIVMVNLLKVYGQVVGADLASSLRPLYVVLSAAGLGVIGFSAPRLALHVVGRKLTTKSRVAGGAVAVALLAIGLWSELGPGSYATLGAVIGIAAILAAGFVVFRRGLGSVGNARVRSLVRTTVSLLPPLILIMIAQACLFFVPGMPVVIRELPFSALLSLLVTDSVLLVFALRYLFREDAAPACVLSEHFISKFSISPRECEIVSMMVQGFSNRLIAEKLFISAMTVKNHVYHIYRKTSAANKVQLLNLINSLK
jgi:DNA-binding CsgD family transcriptional regulator